MLKLPKINFRIILIFFLPAIPLFILLIFFLLPAPKVQPHGSYIFHSSLTDSEQNFLKSILDSHRPTIDLTVSGFSTTNLSSLPADDFSTSSTLLAQVQLPVADFYSSKLNADSKDQTQKYLPFEQLEPKHRVLSLDHQYFFDSFRTGAKFRLFRFSGAPADIDFITNLIRPKLPDYPQKATTLSFTQTGVTALSRAMIGQLRKAKTGKYFSQHIGPFLKSADLTHISNEVSFADPCNTPSGSVVLCSPSQMFETITDIGADIVELTGNHNNDYGIANNIATIQKYHNHHLKTFGGGKDESSAAKPLEIEQKNTKITLLGYNYSTSTKANGQGANQNRPGANIYDEARAQKDIKTAKSKNHFVIVSVQFFECYSYPDRGAEMPACDAPIPNQTEFFRHLIDLGADLVIGTQAHQPQTYELYKNKPIFYGLGNLFFDQTYWPGTTRSLVLTHYFHNGRHLQTKITPTFYDGSYQTKVMPTKNAESFLYRLLQSRPASPEPYISKSSLLQSAVDNWVNTHKKDDLAVSIYDLDQNILLASHNADKNLFIASIYKLFVAYEGYRLAEKNNNFDQPFLGKLTYADCLDKMIRSSDSPCAETMANMIGQQRLNQLIVSEFNLKNSTLYYSNTKDLTALMKLYYLHPDLSANSWHKIQDSMLNQPIVNKKNWRRGLPSGFSDQVKVYNKVGWHSDDGVNWKFYHDAAIVYFPKQNRHLSVVVLTENTHPDQIAKLAKSLELAIDRTN